MRQFGMIRENFIEENSVYSCFPAVCYPCYTSQQLPLFTRQRSHMSGAHNATGIKYIYKYSPENAQPIDLYVTILSMTMHVIACVFYVCGSI